MDRWIDVSFGAREKDASMAPPCQRPRSSYLRRHGTLRHGGAIPRSFALDEITLRLKSGSDIAACRNDLSTATRSPTRRPASQVECQPEIVKQCTDLRQWCSANV